MSKVRVAATYVAISAALAVFATAVVAAMPQVRAWATTPGGVSSGQYEPEAPPASGEAPETTETTGEPGRAKLVAGRAVPPLDAPPAVRQVIAAANKIRAKPYVWGGGHQRWWDRGYDCSGAVSYALHGAGLIASPMPSGPMESWGLPGRGRWITVYANAGHAYAIIAGLRWDTAGVVNGTGPRWHRSLGAQAAGPFIARHPPGY